MPNQELKLAAVQADIASDEPAVQSEPKQDLKQFGDFSLGEIAGAMVSRRAVNGDFLLGVCRVRDLTSINFCPTRKSNSTRTAHLMLLSRTKESSGTSNTNPHIG